MTGIDHSDSAEPDQYRYVRHAPGSNKWQARPWYNGRHINLGLYHTDAEAAQVVREWRRRGPMWRPDHILPRFVFRQNGQFFARKRIRQKKILMGPFETAESADVAMRKELHERLGPWAVWWLYRDEVPASEFNEFLEQMSISGFPVYRFRKLPEIVRLADLVMRDTNKIRVAGKVGH